MREASEAARTGVCGPRAGCFTVAVQATLAGGRFQRMGVIRRAARSSKRAKQGAVLTHTALLVVRTSAPASLTLRPLQGAYGTCTHTNTTRAYRKNTQACKRVHTHLQQYTTWSSGRPREARVAGTGGGGAEGCGTCGSLWCEGAGAPKSPLDALLLPGSGCTAWRGEGQGGERQGRGGGQCGGQQHMRLRPWQWSDPFIRI